MYKYLSVSAASKAKIMVLLAVSSTLAGCGMDQFADDNQYVPATHYDRYPIEVAKAPVKLDISSEHGRLQLSQINAISSFARSARNSGASKIALMHPSSGGASGRIAHETYQLLLQSGISSSMIVQGSYPGPAKDPVQLSYVRSVAVTKECGDWSRDMASTSSNEPASNMGCAIQNNIAAMVVNPDDFLAPEPTTPALASMRTPAMAANISSSSISSSNAAAPTIATTATP